MKELTYEECVKLRDCGFPQKDRPILVNCTCGSEEYLGEYHVHKVGSDCMVYCPTTDELIELFIGKGFWLEESADGTWQAGITEDGVSWYEDGPTPKSALCALFITLNGEK